MKILNPLQSLVQSSLEQPLKLLTCFVGVGSAFAKSNSQTSVIFAKNGKTLLVDVGTTVPTELAKRDIKLTDFNGYYFTHSHADHVGGVEELLLTARYVTKQKPRVIITETFQDILWSKTLQGGCEYNETGLLRFGDFINPVRPTWVTCKPREMHRVAFEGMDILIFRTAHIPGGVAEWERAFWSTGLLVDGKVLFTGDTRFDPSIFEDLPWEPLKLIFHDCQLFSPGTVHAAYDSLKTLPAALKQKMYLVHYGDSFGQFRPTADGFVGFAQPWVIHSA